MSNVYPLVFDPLYKPKVWGGDAFARLLNRPLERKEKIGESWELADLENDQSRVASGPLKGQTLHQVLELWGSKLLGAAQPFEERFPLLIKYLDANENLSVQVHPTAEVAKRLGGTVRVKSEAWYVLEARSTPSQPAGLYIGCKPAVTKNQLKDSVATGTTPDLLNFILVKAGDCYYLPSGTLHALGAGVVVAEVQTPSDVTYRLYDWGRKGRELHVAETLDCVNPAQPWQAQPPRAINRQPYSVTRVAECEYFVMEHVRQEQPLHAKLSTGRMMIWMVLQGHGRIQWRGPQGEGSEAFVPGQTLLLPAALPPTVLQTSGPAEWLEVTLPA